MQCDACHDLLLDHLFGLLDAAEGEGVEAHLAACPACVAARERDRRLLASAAKASFPQVRFETPVEPMAPTPPTAPSAEPARPPSDRSRGRWLSRVGWALAASVAFGLLPAAGLERFYRVDDTREMGRMAAYATAHRDAARAELAKVEADEKEAIPAAGKAEAVAAATKARDDLLAAWFAEAKQVVLAEKKRKLGVEVIGPAAVQPGAPNDFTVVLLDRQGAPGTRHVEAQVRDGKEKVLFRQTLDHERKGDRHNLHLPSQLWTDVKPDSDLFLVVATVDPKTGLRTEVQDRFRLLGPVYTTLLTTDKPLYRPGERVFFRSLTLDRASFRPPGREQELRFDLRGPNGVPVPGCVAIGTTELVRPTAADHVEPVLGPDGRPLRGVGTGAFDLPPNLAAGDYTLTVVDVHHPAGYRPAPPASRRIAVRPYSTDRFQKKLEFAGASFSGGDTVSAWCDVRDLEKPVTGASVEPQMIVEGRVQALPALLTDAKGRAAFRFTLPANIDAGDVQLRAVVRVGAVSESRTTRIPVVGRRINIDFFPEGGDLVAGVPCRVYFRATTPLGEPADIRGRVTDGRNDVARVETFTDPEHPGANRGLGAFAFTPKVGTTYRLKLNRPAGAHEPVVNGPVPSVPSAVAGAAAVAASRTGFALPAVKTDGVVMSVVEGVSAPGRPITVQLWSIGRPRQLVVGAYTRGRLMDTRKIAVAPAQPEVVTLAGDANPRGGVTRVTVFEEPPVGSANSDLVPLAERLVFRKPTEELKLFFDLASAADKGAKPIAGEDARLTLRATDEADRPTAAVLYSAVVDANAAAMAEGKRDRLLTTHFLLAGEVQHPDDLEHVDFLLTDGPKAAQALDLLLGTQGWRRFVEQANPIRRKHTVASPDLDRLVMLNGQMPVPGENFLERERRRAHEAFWPKYEAAARRVEMAANRVEDAAPKPAAAAPQIESLRANAKDWEAEAARLRTRALAVANENRSWLRTGAWIAGALSGLLLLGLVLVGGTLSRRLPFAVGGVLAAFAAWHLGASPPPILPDEDEAVLLMAPQDTKPSSPTKAAPSSAPAEPTPKREASKTPESAKQEQGLEAPGPRKADNEAMPMIAGGDRVPARKSADNAAAKEDKDKNGPPPMPLPPTGVMRPHVMRMPPAPMNAGVAPALPAPAMGPGPLAAKIAPAGAAPNGAVGGAATPAAKKGPMAMSRMHVPGAESSGPFIAGANKPSGGLLKAGRAQSADAARRGREGDEMPERQKAMKKVVTQASDNRALDRLQERVAEEARKFVPPPMPPGDRHAKPNETALYFKNVRDTVPRMPPLIVREYAGIRPAWDRSDDESASPDTVLWQPAIVLAGEGTMSLPLRLNPDAVGYQVIVAGHTLDGRLGAVRGTVPVAPAKPVPTK